MLKAVHGHCEEDYLLIATFKDIFLHEELKTLTISLLMLSLVLCGCSSKKVDHYNLSVIAGNNSCSLLHDYTLAKPYLNKTYTQGGQLSIINSDGEPYVVKTD